MMNDIPRILNNCWHVNLGGKKRELSQEEKDYNKINYMYRWYFKTRRRIGNKIVRNRNDKYGHHKVIEWFDEPCCEDMYY